MSGPRIVVTDHAFGTVLHERTVAEQHGRELEVFSCSIESETVEAVRGADVVFVNFAPISAAVTAALAPGATVIRYGIGYDNVDIEAARSRGIRVCNVPDYGADTVADHAVACLLGLLRRTVQFTAAIRDRGWIASNALGPIRGFAETTVGLVGIGRIGRAVIARLQPFGFDVIAHDPFLPADSLHALGVEPVTLDELFARSHAISLHVPLTAESRGVIGVDALAAMGDGTVLVNTSRGGLVDEAAVVDALASGRIGGAALDVFDPEPLRADSPLRRMENVILTPHAAFYSESSLDALQRLAAEEAGRALEGAPLRCQVA